MAAAYSAGRKRTSGANTNKGFGNARTKVATFKPTSAKPPGKPSLSPLGSKPGAKGYAPVRPASRPVAQKAQPDSIYNRQVDLANRKQESALTELGGQETSIKHDFGIDDPTNPFSRAEGLKRAFLARSRGTSAGLAAQGHLYSGAHSRALGRVRLDEEQARAELRQAYEQAIGQVGSAKAGVKFDTEEQKNQAFEDWIARAPESEDAAPAMNPLTTPVKQQQRTPTATKAPPATAPVPKGKQLVGTAKGGGGYIRNAGGPYSFGGQAVSNDSVKVSNSQKAASKLSALRAARKDAKKSGKTQKVKKIQKKINKVKRSR